MDGDLPAVDPEPEPASELPKNVWITPQFKVISKSVIKASFNPGDDGFGLSTGS